MLRFARIILYGIRYMWLCKTAKVVAGTQRRHFDSTTVGVSMTSNTLSYYIDSVPNFTVRPPVVAQACAPVAKYEPSEEKPYSPHLWGPPRELLACAPDSAPDAEVMTLISPFYVAKNAPPNHVGPPPPRATLPNEVGLSRCVGWVRQRSSHLGLSEGLQRSKAR